MSIELPTKDELEDWVKKLAETTVGSHFWGYSLVTDRGALYVCDNYDDSGPWLTNVLDPSDRKQVSHKAIGATYKRCEDDGLTWFIPAWNFRISKRTCHGWHPVMTANKLDMWHASASQKTVYEYLGWTWDQYAAYVEYTGPEAAHFYTTGERDFPIGSGENDNYGNLCVTCSLPFRGHKHQQSCRKCIEEAKARYDAMSQVEKDAHDAKAAADLATVLGITTTTGEPTTPPCLHCTP